MAIYYCKAFLLFLFLQKQQQQQQCKAMNLGKKGGKRGERVSRAQVAPSAPLTLTLLLRNEIEFSRNGAKMQIRFAACPTRLSTVL